MQTRTAARYEQESYYIASQWRLMWRKFKSHRLAMVGTAIVGFFIVTGTLFCEFFATTTSTSATPTTSCARRRRSTSPTPAGASICAPSCTG